MLTERIQLMPGIFLNMFQTDRFKTGCFSFNLLQPLTLEDAAPNALLPSVLLRGCRAYPDMQSISHRLDHLYGATVGTLVRKKGEVQTVGLYTDFLEDRYAENEPLFSQMMEFLGQLLFEPCGAPEGFVEEYVESEALNLANTLDSRINDKRAWAVNRLLHHMCKEEAYSVPRLGEKETLSGINGKNLYERWQKMLSTSPIELFYLGQQSKETVLQAMDKLLKQLPARQVRPMPGSAVIRPQRDVQYVQEAMDVTQGKLTIGLRTDITVEDPRYPALTMLNAVYGSGMTSKLFVEIREAQSLCYYASSSMDKFKGVMMVDCGIEFRNYEIALEGILHQLELCKQGQITEAELESARSYLISSLKAGNDSPGRLDDYAIGQAIADFSDTMDDFAARLQTVTREQVVEAANSLSLDTVYFLNGVEA